MKKIILIISGFILIALGLIGVILPILPSFPFFLLASICFLKSSEKLNNWFEKTKMYKKYVRPFKERKGMTLKAKLFILVPVYIILLTLFFLKDILIMRIVIALLLLIKTIVFIKMPTLKQEDL